jgi:hypothetical protein
VHGLYVCEPHVTADDAASRPAPGAARSQQTIPASALVTGISPASAPTPPPAPLSLLANAVLGLVLACLTIEEHHCSLYAVCRQFRDLLNDPDACAWPLTYVFPERTLRPVGRFSRLRDMRFKHADLGSIDLTDAALAHVATWPLQTLSLATCYKITDTGIDRRRWVR